jgi:hypothetical protein
MNVCLKDLKEMVCTVWNYEMKLVLLIRHSEKSVYV